MAEEEKADRQENEEEKPEIYSVKKGEKGFAYNRRDFLVTAGAGAAAIGMIGMGIDALTPDGQPGQAEAADESQMVSLEVEALGMVVLPVMRGLEHAWKITNRGKNSSPKATLHLSAEHDSQFKLALSVPEIAPGEAVEVPVSLTAPQTAGEYRYQWQLRLGDGAARLNEFVLKATDAVLAESAHPYANNTDQTWTITNPDPTATGTMIHFTQIEVETNYDYIYIRDGSGNLIQTINGSYSNVWSSTVSGTVVRVQLTSDNTITYYGFQVDMLQSVVLNYQKYLPFLRKVAPTPTSYVVCSCNTVDVCICNLVCVCEAVCSCDGYCSCNQVCTCDTVCSCVGYCSCNSVHYWYPN